MDLKKAVSKINIIDVCWTLYSSNTTFDFISFVVRKTKKKKLENKILSIFFVKICLVLIGKILKVDLYRMLYIKLLNGYSRMELEELSNQFYDDFLKKRAITFSFDIIKKMPIEQKKIICSASLDIIVKKIASELSIQNYISSSLKYTNDICIGELDTDILFTKYDFFEGDEINYVLTDNLSDYLLVANAENPVVLSVRKNIPFWNKKGIEVAYVY